MKKLLLGAILLFSTLGFSQTNPFVFEGNGETKTLKHEIVVDLDNQSSKQLYDKVLDYINISYGRAESVITGKSENSFIKIKGMGDCPLSFGWTMQFAKTISYTAIIYVKDNKVKIEIVSLTSDLYNNKGLVSTINELSLTQKWWKENGDVRKIYQNNGSNIELLLYKDLGGLIKSLKNETIVKSDW